MSARVGHHDDAGLALTVFLALAYILASFCASCTTHTAAKKDEHMVEQLADHKAEDVRAEEVVVKHVVDGPDRTVKTIDTYYPPEPAPPEPAPPETPVKGTPAPPRAPAPARGPLKSHEVDVTDHGAVVTDVGKQEHVDAAKHEDAAVAIDDIKHEEQHHDVEVGLSWQVKLGILAAALLALFLLYRFTAVGQFVDALLARLAASFRKTP